MSAPILPTGTVTFLLTDIESSTRLWQENPEAMREAIARHDRLMTAGIVARQGVVLTERGEGDSFFAVFKRAADAVAAAIGVQRSLDFESWPSKLPIRVRMAIHSGDVDEEYRGTVVNRCARLRGLAHGGQVLVSAPTHDLVVDNLPAGVEMRELGRQHLRDLSRPERVFELIDTKLAGSQKQGVRPRWSRRAKLAAGGGLTVSLVAIAALAVGLLVPSRQAVTPGGPTITTVAGLGSAGDSGDNGPATASQLYRPSGIAVDSNGNLVIADRQRVRKINMASGMITGVAGAGGSGYSGDNGPAGQAQMHGVWAIAADRLGSVFVAEKGNNVIRKVSPDGVIATVAGNGVEGYGGDGGPAVQARLNAPQGVAVDAAGNLFIADAGNNRIRRVARDGTITTIAGTGDVGFAGDGGAAAQARLNGPRGLAIDPSGALVIADYGNHRIRKMSAGNLVISTIAGNGKEGFSGDGHFAIDAQLNFPSGVATDGAGNVFVADTSNNRIRKISTNGTITTVAGNGSRAFSGDMGPATAAGLNLPVSVAVDAKGDIYVADTANRRIRHVAGSTQAPASHQPPGLPGQP